MRIQDYAEEAYEQREAVVMCCCRCIVASPFGAAAVIASRREIDGGGGGNHMYRQTRYCCASREKRDMSRVAARVNAVSTSTDQVSAVLGLVVDRLSAGRPGSPQHDAYMPPPPRDDKLRCRVIRAPFGVLHGQITAASAGGRARLARQSADSRITSVEGAYSSIGAVVQQAADAGLETIRTKRARVNKIVACDAVYYPPLRSRCANGKGRWRYVPSRAVSTWRGRGGMKRPPPPRSDGATASTTPARPTT